MIQALGLLIWAFAAGPAFASTWAEKFHLAPVMPDGPYAGQKLNVEAKRAIRILDDTLIDDDFGRKPNEWLVANIYHNKRFYIAEIPKAAIRDVLLLSEPFMGVMIHSLLRFRFSEPVRLIAEVPTLDDLKEGRLYRPLSQPIELWDLMLSVEATSPKGIPEFSAVESFFDTRGLVFRWMSLTGMGVSRFQKGEATVIQYPLNLTPRERARALRNALLKSDEIGMSQMYNTLLANCNQYCFRILERTSTLSLKQRSGFKKYVATAYIFAANFVSFTAINPVLSRLGLTWAMWRRPDVRETPRLEADREFLRLAAHYPVKAACESRLTN